MSIGERIRDASFHKLKIQASLADISFTYIIVIINMAFSSIKHVFGLPLSLVFSRP